MGNLDKTTDILAADRTDELDLARIRPITERIHNELVGILNGPNGATFRTTSRTFKVIIEQYIRSLFRQNREYIQKRHPLDHTFPLGFQLAGQDEFANLSNYIQNHRRALDTAVRAAAWIDIEVAYEISLYNRGYDDADDSDKANSDDDLTFDEIRDKYTNIRRALGARIEQDRTNRVLIEAIRQTADRIDAEIEYIDQLEQERHAYFRPDNNNQEGNAATDETENVLDELEENADNGPEDTNAEETNADNENAPDKENETGNNGTDPEGNNQEEQANRPLPPPPNMPHWVTTADVVTAFKTAGLVKFKAKAVTPESTTAEYNMHLHSLIDLYNDDDVDGIGEQALQSADARGRVHAIREFKILARLTWEDAAAEYWGSVVLESHDHIHSTDGQNTDLGPAWPPATLESARYTHPMNQQAGNISYPGYRDIVKAAQKWAQTRGEAPKYEKVDWKPASYDGSAAKLTQWEQTVDAITTANNLPAILPDAFKIRVTHAIATQFTGLAAEAWSKEANKPTQIRTQGQQQGVINWCRAKFLSHAHAQERFLALQTTRWTTGSLTEYNEKHKVLQSEAQQDNTAPTIQIDWYLNALPTPLAAKARNTLAGVTLSAKAAGNQYQPTLDHVMDLAIQLQADFDLQQRRPQGTRKSNQTGNRSDNGRPGTSSNTGSNNNGNRNNPGRRSDTDKGKKPIVCYKCRQEGHLANNCTNKAVPSYCKDCGESHAYGQHTNKKQTFIALLRTEGRRQLPLHCKATILGRNVNLVLDTGARINLVSKHFLDKIGKKIQKPTDVIVHTASGSTFRPLGEIDDLPIQIEDQSIPTMAYVSDTDEYDILICLAWLKRVQAVLDFVNMDLTIRCDGTLISTNLYDEERIKEIQQETEDLAVEPEPNLKHETVMYTVAVHDPMAAPLDDPPKPPPATQAPRFPPPLSSQDLDAFVQYAWLRTHMGKAGIAEDSTGYRCPAGYFYCYGCYRTNEMCEEGRNACKYWREYAGKEPEYWQDAAERIIDSRRPTNSPKYRACPDDWRDVLRDTHAQLYPLRIASPVDYEDNDPAEIPITAGPSQLAHPRADEYWDWVQHTNPDAFDPVTDLPYATKYDWAEDNGLDDLDPWTDDYELKDEHF